MGIYMKKILSIILVNKAKTKSVISFFVIISTVFLSCKEKEPTAPEQISASVTISAENGGTVTTEDGISLIIPPGALTKDIEVKLTSLDGCAMHEWGVSTVHIEPDGLVLNNPAKLTFKLPSDWSEDNYPFVFVSFDSNPEDYLNTGMCADIIQTENGFTAETEILHFSHWGLVRNCHKGTLVSLLKNFEENGCGNTAAWEKVKEKYPNINTEIISNSQPDPNILQGFLGTYFQDIGGFNKNEAITKDRWDEILNYVKQEKKRVVVLFTKDNWGTKNSNGFYNRVPHSAIFDFKNGKLKLRNSISAGSKYLDPLIAKNGENVIWIPSDDRDISLNDIDSFRNIHSFEALEKELSDKPQLFSHLPPVAKRTQPWKGIRFYLSNYSTDENPCTSGDQYYVIVTVYILGSYVYNDGETFDGLYMYDPGAGHARYGTLKNGQFESQWLKPFGGGSSKGTIKLNVDFSSSPPIIIDYYVEEVEIMGDKETNIIEGKNVNIPGHKRSYGGYKFSISGVETFNKITTLQNELEGPDNYGWKLTGISCDSDSYITIILGGE